MTAADGNPAGLTTPAEPTNPAEPTSSDAANPPEPTWDERYLAAPALWSGHANDELVTEASALPPGTALDVGCGEGGDALWLARQGWAVTGVDVSGVALARAAAQASAEGLTVDLLQIDATVTGLPAGPFDLVTSHFLHVPRDAFLALVDGMAQVTAPGGTLLVVGHDRSDITSGVRRPQHPDRFVAASELAGRLDPAVWTVLAAEPRRRTEADHDGAERTVHDAVLHARRRA